MDDRESLILEHVGRYTLSLRTVIEDLFFDGRDCGNALGTMVKRGLIQSVPKALNGGYAYYQLAQKGAKTLGLSPNRASGKGAKALATNLGVLWFSCKNSTRRKRLTNTELDTLFGAPEGDNVPFVAQFGDEDDTTVFRLFVPGEEADVKTSYTALKETAYEAMNNDRLRPWIDRGTYRFAVLVHNDARKKWIISSVAGKGFPKLAVEVEVVPTPTTIPDFIAPGEEAE